MCFYQTLLISIDQIKTNVPMVIHSLIKKVLVFCFIDSFIQLMLLVLKRLFIEIYFLSPLVKSNTACWSAKIDLWYYDIISNDNSTIIEDITC